MVINDGVLYWVFATDANDDDNYAYFSVFTSPLGLGGTIHTLLKSPLGLSAGRLTLSHGIIVTSNATCDRVSTQADIECLSSLKSCDCERLWNLSE